LVARLGVEIPALSGASTAAVKGKSEPFRILSVGRLHAVKDHASLIRACARLQAQGIDFCCEIAGEGPERRRLEFLIRRLGIQGCVHLLGHADREQLESLYSRADLVVLTSRSEGIPLVLMEAMARGKLVLAPAITGIPELVFPGQTGFLYQPGSMNDFLDQLIAIRSTVSSQAGTDVSGKSSVSGPSAEQFAWIRHAARVQVELNFNRKKNLKSFGDLFLRRVRSSTKEIPHESAVRQQVQLPIQRY
jgi:glycosyltransferase involved in cell wall biosynthesis